MRSTTGSRFAMTTVAVAVVSALAVALVVVTTRSPSASSGVRADSSSPRSDPSYSGVYPGNGGPPSVAAFESWLGGPVHYVTLYLDDRDWKFVERPQHFGLAAYEKQPYRISLSVPLIPTDSSNTIEQGAAGDLDYHFRDLAQSLVSMGMGNIIVRLGWELSGGWYPWSAQKDPGAYAEYWRQVVDTMRAVPGSDFQFDWNGGAAGQTGFAATAAYPGDAYVDYVSADIYDWDPAAYRHNSTDAEITQEWWYNTVLSGTGGLDWTASFAAAHHKLLAIPEWGLMIRPDGQGGGDDPQFVSDVHQWIVAHHVAYADYFDYDAGSGVDGNLTDGRFPRAAALYQNLFGA